jgi:NitT/TauT family transport system permease protein
VISRLRSPAFVILGIAGVFGIWELLVGAVHVPSYIVPTPFAVWNSAVTNRTEILSNMGPTVIETAVGFAIGSLAGIAAAIIFVWVPWVRSLFYPMLIGSQAVPKIAVAPILVVWLGFGITPKVVMVLLLCFFPVIVNAISSFDETPEEYYHLMRSMGGSRLQIFRKVEFPNALPGIMAGLQIGITLAIVGAIVGELLGGTSGLGYLISIAGSNVDMALMFAVIIVLTILAVILFYMLELLRRLILRGRGESRGTVVVNQGTL